MIVKYIRIYIISCIAALIIALFLVNAFIGQSSGPQPFDAQAAVDRFGFGEILIDSITLEDESVVFCCDDFDEEIGIALYKLEKNKWKWKVGTSFKLENAEALYERIIPDRLPFKEQTFFHVSKYHFAVLKKDEVIPDYILENEFTEKSFRCKNTEFKLFYWIPKDVL